MINKILVEQLTVYYPAILERAKMDGIKIETPLNRVISDGVLSMRKEYSLSSFDKILLLLNKAGFIWEVWGNNYFTYTIVIRGYLA